MARQARRMGRPLRVAPLIAADHPAAANPSPGNQPVTVLDHSSRYISKATLVPVEVDQAAIDSSAAGQALVKLGYVRQLTLQPGEVAAVRNTLSAFADAAAQNKDFSSTSPLWDLLTSFEGSPMPSLLPSARDLATASVQTLKTFGQALKALRQQRVDHLAGNVVGAPNSPINPAARIAGAGLGPGSLDLATSRDLLNRSAVANSGFEVNTALNPIGMMHLERLEMTPAGIVPGELIATIPLAPNEQTAVVQKEWSVTTKEFTSIVTDSLETYSETGVTDNTELTQSTTSQIQHGNQFNITGTVSGGIDLISGSSTSTVSAQDSASQSATDSRKHAATVTQKASSRSKQEHKVTISTTTVTGTSETTTRTLTNPSATNPIRIDYFSMMRNWRVRLYRYALRLTYDVVIPEPGGALRKAYAQLDGLRQGIGPFVFNIPHSEITDSVLPSETDPHYRVLADRYGAQVRDPVSPNLAPMVFNFIPRTGGGALFTQLSFSIPDGYRIIRVTLDGSLTGPGGVNIGFGVIGTTFFQRAPQPDQMPLPSTELKTASGVDFLFHAEGAQNVLFMAQDANSASVNLTVEVERSPDGYAQWQSDVWNALYSAAQTQYYAQQQDIAAQISQLEDELANVDTLTLRREESEEIMKGVLRFILGNDFDFMPKDVEQAIKGSGADLTHGVGFTGNDLGLSHQDWTIVTSHENTVRFLNQAIEWENVVTFLYSYFWDVPDSWDFIRRIKHPDATRQAFLRAGSARVVLTVRRGWEDDWILFTQGGFEGASIPNNHPYLTIAQEIAAYDDTNYPGIPPANPGLSGVRLEDAVYTTSSASVQPSADPAHPAVNIPVDSSAGFVVGLPVAIGPQGSPEQELQMVTARPADGTHITVEKLVNSHDGTSTPFLVFQPGEKGVLIAEWNEYTPTSGTDIKVTSNLATIA
jgi:hypothetical protein